MLHYAMRQAIENDQKRSRRHNPVKITDLDFADDIALVTEEMKQSQDFLHHVQPNAAKIGLQLACTLVTKQDS